MLNTHNIVDTNIVKKMMIIFANRIQCVVVMYRAKFQRDYPRRTVIMI